MPPVRHGTASKRYEDNLVRHIIKTIEPLPGSAEIARDLRAGKLDAVQRAYNLARQHGLVMQYN